MYQWSWYKSWKNLWNFYFKLSNNSNLFFTTNFKEGISNSDIIFIAVGTPMGEDGSADFSLIKKKLKNSIIPLIIVLKIFFW